MISDFYFLFCSVLLAENGDRVRESSRERERDLSSNIDAINNKHKYMHGAPPNRVRSDQTTMGLESQK